MSETLDPEDYDILDLNTRTLHDSGSHQATHATIHPSEDGGEEPRL